MQTKKWLLLRYENIPKTRQASCAYLQYLTVYDVDNNYLITSTDLMYAVYCLIGSGHLGILKRNHIHNAVQCQFFLHRLDQIPLS